MVLSCIVLFVKVLNPFFCLCADSDILNDFFKPITADMERLKSIKKTRIGRRSKQLERYEQKMKEERQKRIRERQKEFFSEVEVHRYAISWSWGWILATFKMFC